jgi:hypothetical protein
MCAKMKQTRKMLPLHCVWLWKDVQGEIKLECMWEKGALMNGKRGKLQIHVLCLLYYGAVMI